MSEVDVVDLYGAEEAEIRRLEWYDDLDIRRSPHFAQLVAEIRKRHYEARSQES